MTFLHRPVKRVVYDVRRGNLVVTLTPEGVYIRHKGRRTTYGPVPYSLILLRGEQMAAQALITARKLARKSKRTAPKYR